MSPSRTVPRICPLCEATCGLLVTLDEDSGRATSVRGNPDDVFSRGYICPKGAAFGEFDADPARLTAPLVRRADGRFEEVGWPEAFDVVRDGIRGVIERTGRESLALYMGNPVIHTLALPLYMFALRERLGTRHVYSSASLDTMPKSVVCGLLYGDPLAVPLPDIDRTALLVILGGNPMESNGSLWTAPDLPGRFSALRARGGRLVVVDPRRTRTARRADQHIPVRPGTDALLLAAIVQTLFAEGLATDPGPHFDGLAEVEKLAAAFTPERVAAACRIAPEVIRTLARDLAAAPAAAVYGRLGTCTTAFGALTSWLIEIVNILTGNLDRPGGTLFGQAPHALRRTPGPFTVGRWSSRVSGLPEMLGELPTAVLSEEIETPGDGQIRGLICVAGNIVLAAPNGDRLDELLPRLDFFVSVDPYLTETSRHASVILPPPRPLESPHYDVVLGSRAIRRTARFSPPARPLAPGQPSEGEILARIALAASGDDVHGDPEQIDEALIDGMLRAIKRPELKAALTGTDALERRLDLMLRLGPFRLKLDDLRTNPDGIDFGPLEPRLDAILAAGPGRVRLCPPEIVADLPRLDALADQAGDGFLLIARRQLRSLNSWSHGIRALAGGSTRCVAELNSADAERLGIGAGDDVVIRGRHGSVTLPAAPTDDLMPGVVSLPYGWGHGRGGTRMGAAAADPGVSVNTLTDDAVRDPVSGVAVFNGVPVDVEKSARGAADG
ncbi:MAG TPA: molybdopterin-dependent oxidoreductase [Actinospica sp.]|nr:molybdopterin-dependent oxidoreductase [Actinospica sp.]